MNNIKVKHNSKNNMITHTQKLNKQKVNLVNTKSYTEKEVIACVNEAEEALKNLRFAISMGESPARLQDYVCDVSKWMKHCENHLKNGG